MVRPIPQPTVRRRTFLRDGAALSTIGLAGCLGGPTGDVATETASPMPTESPTRPSTPTATASPSPTASPTPEPTGTATEESGGFADYDDTGDTPSPSTTPTASPTATPTPARDLEVTVGPDGRLRFTPERFEIAVGRTVRWVWEAGGHNVKPSATPSGSDWSGTPGSEFETFSAGYTYEYTFEVAGQYEYYCAPHRSSGMTGSFAVE